jgi:hypothetical protein
MNILLLLFLYFIISLTGKGKDNGFLGGLKLESLTPLINLFSGGKLDIASLLQSDLIKNINIKGFDAAKIAPMLELFNNLKSSDLFNSFTGGKTDAAEEKQEKKPDTKSDFPLSPISDIADKNITYSLSKYLSNNSG